MIVSKKRVLGQKNYGGSPNAPPTRLFRVKGPMLYLNCITLQHDNSIKLHHICRHFNQYHKDDFYLQITNKEKLLIDIFSLFSCFCVFFLYKCLVEIENQTRNSSLLKIDIYDGEYIVCIYLGYRVHIYC